MTFAFRAHNDTPLEIERENLKTATATFHSLHPGTHSQKHSPPKVWCQPIQHKADSSMNEVGHDFLLSGRSKLLHRI